MPLAFAILDGIAAGLEAMHAAGIGHLDVKPANIILRETAAADRLAAGARRRRPRLPPVLVDFGLAGRKVRPGCASPYYGAPEVWDRWCSGLAAEPGAGRRLRLLLPGLRAADGPPRCSRATRCRR